MATAMFRVEGMSCAHCVGSVREEVDQVAGVEVVELDLATGRLEVRSADGPVPEAAVVAAVERAGYSVR